MTYEFRSNGKLEIELHAETEIEHAFLSTLGRSADKGTAVKVSVVLPDVDALAGLILSMEQKHAA
jgi:hypothetical protein